MEIWKNIPPLLARYIVTRIKELYPSYVSKKLQSFCRGLTSIALIMIITEL